MTYTAACDAVNHTIYTGPWRWSRRYDPATVSFTHTSTIAVPVARDRHTAVWTGSRMIVWGGASASPPSFLASGGRYDPLLDGWAATSAIDAPAARDRHSAAWTGSRMIVWGGTTLAGGDGRPPRQQRVRRWPLRVRDEWKRPENRGPRGLRLLRAEPHGGLLGPRLRGGDVQR